MSYEIATAFESRARALGALVGAQYEESGWNVYRWATGPYEANEYLNYAIIAPDRIQFFRDADRQAVIEFGNIKPKGIASPRYHPPVTIKSDIQRSVSLVVDATDRKEDFAFRNQISWSHQIGSETEQTHSLTVAIRDCFTAGGDAAPVKNELEITASTENAWRSLASEITSVAEENEISGTAFAGKCVRYWMERSVQTQRHRMTGFGNFSHDVRIGRHRRHRGRWEWSGDAYWSDWSDFLSCLHGTAPDSWSGSVSMRNHPPDLNLVNAVEREVNAAFEFVETKEAVSDYQVRSAEV